MQLNRMQREVIDSKKRITIITPQSGAGTTTALIMKLAHEVSENKNNLGIFVRRTDQQITGAICSFLRNIQGSRYSKDSNILTFKYNGKKVKIKILSYENLNLNEYIPVVAVDIGCHIDNMQDLLNCAGKIVVSDFISNLEEKDSWVYRCGLLTGEANNITWHKSVAVIKGYYLENPGLTPQYIECLNNLDKNSKYRLLRVDF